MMLSRGWRIPCDVHGRVNPLEVGNDTRFPTHARDREVRDFPLKVVSCLSDVMNKLLQLLKNFCLVSLLNSRVNISGFLSVKKSTNAQI
jgi:hypothetical protein